MVCGVRVEVNSPGVAVAVQQPVIRAGTETTMISVVADPCAGGLVLCRKAVIAVTAAVVAVSTIAQQITAAVATQQISVAASIGYQGVPGPQGGFVQAIAQEVLVAGQPVYSDQINGRFRLADASLLTKSGVVGLATDSVLVGFVATAQQLSVTLPDWTAVVGAGTLQPGAVYFLHLVPGRLSTTAPVVPGQSVTRVGTAISPTTMAIEIQQPILL